jgi:hypothetical protein
MPAEDVKKLPGRTTSLPQNNGAFVIAPVRLNLAEPMIATEFALG